MQNFSFPSWDSPLAAPVETLFQQLPAWRVSPGEDPLPPAKTNTATAGRILNELRSLVEGYHFENLHEEMIFFKKIKPVFSGSLIYWSRFLRLTAHEPVGGGRVMHKYWKSALHELSRFFKQHSGFYVYMRTGDSRLDELYFLRRESGPAPFSTDLNPRFTTARDHLAGKILAFGLIEQYIMQRLKDRHQSAVAPHQKLQWTGPKAALVELIYALECGGMYNQGRAGIKEIAEAFQAFFQVDLGNYYHVFNEIRLRKKNRTCLLDQLREGVLKKMDAMDEK